MPQHDTCNGNHTANDAANCEVFKRVISSKETKQISTKPANRLSPTINQHSMMRSTQTYAEKVRTNSNELPSKDNKNLSINDFIDSQNKMMSNFMAMILKNQKQFIFNFKNRNG